MPIGSGTVDYSNERANKWNPEIGFRSSSNSLDDPYSFPRSVAGKQKCVHFRLLVSVVLNNLGSIPSFREWSVCWPVRCTQHQQLGVLLFLVA